MAQAGLGARDRLIGPRAEVPPSRHFRRNGQVDERNRNRLGEGFRVNPAGALAQGGARFAVGGIVSSRGQVHLYCNALDADAGAVFGRRSNDFGVSPGRLAGAGRRASRARRGVGSAVVKGASTGEDGHWL